MVTLVIVSRPNAHPLTFLLQMATLPHLCCSTTLSHCVLQRCGAWHASAGLCPWPPLAQKTLPGVGGGGTLPQHFAHMQGVWVGLPCAWATWLSSLCVGCWRQPTPRLGGHVAHVHGGPPTRPVWGHCIRGVYKLHELQVGENQTPLPLAVQAEGGVLWVGLNFKSSNPHH